MTETSLFSRWDKIGNTLWDLGTLSWRTLIYRWYMRPCARDASANYSHTSIAFSLCRPKYLDHERFWKMAEAEGQRSLDRRTALFTNVTDFCFMYIHSCKKSRVVWQMSYGYRGNNDRVNSNNLSLPHQKVGQTVKKRSNSEFVFWSGEQIH